jgi:hypothetical protein
MEPRISRMDTNGLVEWGHVRRGATRCGVGANFDGRGRIVVERTMWPWWGDGWMLSHCGGSAAPAGAGLC